jgi:hypothetical protein
VFPVCDPWRVFGRLPLPPPRPPGEDEPSPSLEARFCLLPLGVEKVGLVPGAEEPEL